MTRGARATRGAWWIALAFVLVALGAAGFNTFYRLRYLERVDALGAGAAGTAGRGAGVHRILPAPYLDGYAWLTTARRMAESGRFRLHWTDVDNAPTGRPVHWSSLYVWWLMALGAVGGASGGATFASAIERASPYAGPLLLALTLPLLAWMAARRSGAAGAAVIALALAGAFPLAENFFAGNVDHHGMIVAAAMASGLALAAGGGGWMASESRASARRWFLVSGVAAAVGLWVSAVSVSLVLAGIGLGAAASALLSRGGDRGSSESAPAPWPEAWRIWGWSGGLASLAFYLIEYFPHEMGLRLEVNHPLHALAFIGGGELIAAWWRLRLDGVLAHGDQVRAGGAAILVLLLPLAVLAGGPAWYSLRDPFLWRLHQDIEEFRPLLPRFTHSTPGGMLAALSPLPLFLVAGILVAADSRRPAAVRALVLLALGPALLLGAFSLWQARWVGLWMAELAVLGAVALGALTGEASRREARRNRLAQAALVTLLLPCVLLVHGAFRMVADARAQAENRSFVPDDVISALLRDLALLIAAGEPPDAPRPIVLASPDATVALTYFADLRGIGTLYWENLPGLRAAAAMFAAETAEETRALLQTRGVTHVLLFTERSFIGTYYALVHGHLDVAAAKRTFLARILFAGETPPAWLRPLPYALPIERLANRPLRAVVLEVER